MYMYGTSNYNDLLSEIEKGVFCLVMCVGQRKNSEFP